MAKGTAKWVPASGAWLARSAGRRRDQYLDQKLHFAGQSLDVSFGDLQVIVHKPNGAVAERHGQDRPDEGIGQILAQQGRGKGRDQIRNPPMVGVPAWSRYGFQAVVADRLSSD